MALPSSGPLRFSEIRNEFNSNDPVLLSQYYRGQGLVPDSGPNANIPLTPGVAISVSNFYGATNGIVLTIGLAGSPYEDLDIKAEVDAFDPTAWASGLPIQVIVEAGVVIGGTVATTPAMTIPLRPTGPLSLTNNGDIQGAGGVDSAGGNAILTNTPITINNQGQVYAGGGAGGVGGQGGDGRNISPGQPASCVETGGYCDRCPPGQSILRPQGSCGPGRPFYVCCQNFPGSPPSFPRAPGSGQAGGLGGFGQGYLPQPSPTPGQPATGPIGGNNIPGGTGGTGGDGGTWGQPGATGANGAPSTAGYAYEPARQNGNAGFPGGFYIVNNNLVTWTNIGDALGNISP